jgi:hypothetical protein
VAGEFLAPYEARRMYVDLTTEELDTYTKCREEYRRFVSERGISHERPRRLPPLPVRGEQVRRRVGKAPGVPRAEAVVQAGRAEVQAARRAARRSTLPTAC